MLSAGEGRSDKIMLKQKPKAKYPINLRSFRLSGVWRVQRCASLVGFIMPLMVTLAAGDENPGDCLGIGFDVTHPVTIA